MVNISLKADKRDLTGRKVKKLRRGGSIPANIYGKDVKSQAIQVSEKEFDIIFNKAGETNLVDILLAGKKIPTLIHNVQVDPVSDNPLHVDFLQVNLKEKVVAQIPVELVGESPAEKQGLGTVVQYINEVEVESLPQDLPDKFEIELGNLSEVDQSLSIKDLKVSQSVDIKNDKEQIIVKVEPPKEEKEAEVPAAEVVPAEGEVEGEPKKEGEATPGSSESSKEESKE